MATEQPEPRDVVPDDFVENWGGDNVLESLEIAERACTSSDRCQLPRCRYCGSFRIHRKPSLGRREIKNRVDGEYRCSTCHGHFDNPAPTIAEVREDLRDDLPEAAERAGRLAAVLGGVDR